MALPKIQTAVDAEISRVIARGRDNRVPNARAPRLTFEDSAANGIPQFLQVDRVDWPPAITEMLGAVQSHSQMGYFSELQRTWLSIDNKLVLWNHVTGRDLCVFGGFSQLIVSVGEPVRPKQGVFRDCISRIIPIASCDVVALIGVQQKVGANGSVLQAETRLVDLEFTCAAPCMIVKFATDPSTGNIFAAGADGNVYQVHYNRTASVLYPRMSLNAASGNGMIRSSYNFIVSTLKTSLGGVSAPPLVDLCFDHRSQMIYSLNASNMIEGFERRGASLVCSFKHTHEAAKGSGGGAAVGGGSGGGSPLVALHVGMIPNTVVGVTEGGERIIFKVSVDAWTNQCGLQETSEVFPSPLSPQHILTRSWFAEGMFVGSSVDANATRNPDAVTFVCDGVQGEPSIGYRALVSSGETLRVEHICEVDAPSPYASSIQQIMSPPRLVLLIHRKGVLVYMRLRPVDILHLILESPTREERDRRLTQFSSRCSSVEFCVMLSQIASRSNPQNVLSQRASNGIIGNSGNEHAARCLLAGPSSDTSRQAVDLLRRYALPTIEEKLRGSTRDITVNFSPFAIGSLTYLSRALITVWNITPLLLNENGLTSSTISKLASTEAIVGRFIAFLEHCQGDLWFETNANGAGPSSSNGASSSSSSSGVSLRDVVWDRASAKIEIPQTAMFVASTDAKVIQAAFIQSMLEFARAVSQVISFFMLCGRFERRVLDHFGKELSASKEYNTDIKSTIGKFIMNGAEAKKVARYVAKTVVQSSSVCPKEVTLLFEEMERESPFLFDAADREEYETILQFTSMMERSNMVSDAAIQQVLGRTAGIAGGLYKSGALMPLVARLQQINMHREAVSLCLYAAAQLGTEGDDWEKLMLSTTQMLERIYEFDRHTFNALVGTPNSTGSMWYARPNDSRTHWRLLAWLGERRTDENLTHTLQSTLVKVASTELEPFLCRNMHTLGLVYAEYLARSTGDFRAAVEVCSRLLQDPLLHIEPSERLAYRLECARKAVECALEGSTAQRTGAEHAMELLLLQTKLMGVIQRFLSSGSRALDDLVADNSGRTQRDLASQHLLLLQSEIISQEKLFVLALNYEVMEEAMEVAMEALGLNRTYDAMVVSRLLQRVISLGKGLSDIGRFVQRFGRRAGFPTVSLILLVEQQQYQRHPNGSSAVPRLLIESGLEFDTVFNAYSEIIERRAVGLATALGIEGRIPDGYLLYSQASLVQRADARVGGAARFVSILRTSLDRLLKTATQQEKVSTLKAVSDLIDSL